MMDQFYSIVDGHRSPPGLFIPSRPWKKADSQVYTVALASILAKSLRHQIVQDIARKYPAYGFDRHGGYPTREHIAALHELGPCPGVHRRTCKVVQDYQQWNGNTDGRITTRKNFLTSAAAVTTGTFIRPTMQAEAMTYDKKRGVSLPDPGEIEAAIPTHWNGVDNPITSPAQQLKCLDESSDALFYEEPRFVEHVDEQAVGLLTDYVTATVKGKESVLDLCSSWTSHIRKDSDDDDDDDKLPNNIVGLGMNMAELQANSVLTDRTVQDLNVKPVLPYADNSFDVVLCQLSIDYLTQPLQVCREIGRVLKPGGQVHILFSNRLFLQKAVGLWTGADDIDHSYTVGAYLHFSQGNLFTNIQARDLSVRNRKKGIIEGDPLYVVTATKA
jgi:SAM-dependent methyltransferase